MPEPVLVPFDFTLESKLTVKSFAQRDAQPLCYKVHLEVLPVITATLVIGLFCKDGVPSAPRLDVQSITNTSQDWHAQFIRTLLRESSTAFTDALFSAIKTFNDQQLAPGLEAVSCAVNHNLTGLE